MVAGGIAVPNALVEVMTDFVALDPTDWDAWQAAANEVEDAMWKEPCECGAMRVVTAFRDGAEQRREEPVNKLGSYGHRYATCDEQNDAEYEARIGERPEAALERRLSYLRAWDAVCHGSRVSNACWDALLSEDLQLRSPHLYGPVQPPHLYGPLCDFATAMGLLELGPRDVLARLRKPLTDQHLVDVHRAIHLDDVAAFVSLVRERPRYLLVRVESGGYGGQLGFREHKRGTLQIDAAVEQHIKWLPKGMYPRVIATLGTVLQSVQPAGIFPAAWAVVEDGE